MEVLTYLQTVPQIFTLTFLHHFTTIKVKDEPGDMSDELNAVICLSVPYFCSHMFTQTVNQEDPKERAFMPLFPSGTTTANGAECVIFTVTLLHVH